jgi:glutamine synthetase
MIDMARRSYLPAVTRYLGELSDVLLTKTAALEGIPVRYETEQLRTLSALCEEAYDAILALESAEKTAAATEDVRERARVYAGSVCPAMQTLRSKIDSMEPLVPTDAWPVPGYGDLMFGV